VSGSKELNHDMVYYFRGLQFRDINTNISLSCIIVLLLISLGLIGSLIRRNQNLWFIELDVLLIIPTSLGGVAAALPARSRD